MHSLRTSSAEKRRRPDPAFVWAGLIGAVLLCAVLSIGLGAVMLSPRTLAAVLTGRETGTAASAIVLYTRLPRTAGCLLAGAALALSGVLIQSVLANPLASPGTIGVNSGAGCAVAVCGALFPNAVGLTPAAAFAGAFAGVMIVLVIAQRAGASRITLVLAGVAISGMFGAVIDAVVSLCPDALLGYSDFRIGGFSNLTAGRLIPALWMIVLSGGLAILMSGELDVLRLGSDTAKSLGLPVKRVRLLFLTLSAVLAGAAVSFAGLLGFVGLMVPHIMRRLVGEESRALLLSSALGGAALLTFCDVLARVLFAPYELSVGILLALLGGPFFIGLLLRQRGGRTHD